MAQRIAKKATNRNIPPTIQCFVQKHKPAARNMSVAAMRHCSGAQHCTRNCMGVIP